jgi:hypothetical protein
VHEDLRGLTQIESEANTLYDTWRKYLYDWGARDKYWQRIIEQAQEFSDKYGDYGKHVVVARTQVLEKVWREHLGIAYSGLLEGMEQEEEKEIN